MPLKVAGKEQSAKRAQGIDEEIRNGGIKGEFETCTAPSVPVEMRWG